MKRALVAFALKDEFVPWRRRHHFRRLSISPYPVTVASFGSTEVYVALVGAGAPESHRFNGLTTQLTPSLGIVTGVAAGLKPEWRLGDVLVANSVCGPDGGGNIPSDPDLVNLASQCGAKPANTLVTLPRIARTVAGKKQLASFADAADMESLPLMKQWSAQGIPALALRVILDPLDMPMTFDFESTLDDRGQVRIIKILAQLAHHPQLLPDLLHLARESRQSLTMLARFLDQFFELMRI